MRIFNWLKSLFQRNQQPIGNTKTMSLDEMYYWLSKPAVVDEDAPNAKAGDGDTEQCSTVNGTLKSFKTIVDNHPQQKAREDE